MVYFRGLLILTYCHIKLQCFAQLPTTSAKDLTPEQPQPLPTHSGGRVNSPTPEARPPPLTPTACPVSWVLVRSARDPRQPTPWLVGQAEAASAKTSARCVSVGPGQTTHSFNKNQFQRACALCIHIKSMGVNVFEHRSMFMHKVSHDIGKGLHSSPQSHTDRHAIACARSIIYTPYPLHHLSQTPGPGTYVVVSPQVCGQRSHTYSLLGRNFLPNDTTQKPGPGAHHPEKVFAR